MLAPGPAAPVSAPLALVEAPPGPLLLLLGIDAPPVEPDEPGVRPLCIEGLAAAPSLGWPEPVGA